MFGGWVLFLVTLHLAIDIDVGFPLRVYDEAAPITFHKGCCHIVKGLSRSGTFYLLDRSNSPKIISSHRMHESTTDA